MSGKKVMVMVIAVVIIVAIVCVLSVQYFFSTHKEQPKFEQSMAIEQLYYDYQ